MWITPVCTQNASNYIQNTTRVMLTSQNTMYCGGEPEASYMKRHIAVYILIAHKHVSCTCHESNF